jgi:probable addiction module antidote protein
MKKERKIEKSLETKPYDTADHLNSIEDVAYYLEAVLEEDDPALLVHSLGKIARSKGMVQLAKETGIARESLYKALREVSKPQFATIYKVIRAMGLRIELHPANNNDAATPKRAKRK